MPSLTAIRDAAVATLKPVFPGIKRIEAFAGELDLDTAKVKNLPAGTTILVAALEAVNESRTGALDFTGTLAVLAVTKNLKDREIREAQSLGAAETAAAAIHGNVFGLSGVSPALVMALTPFAADELDDAGLAVWSVVWQQAFTFDRLETV